MRVIIGAAGPERDEIGRWVASRIRDYTLPAEYVALACVSDKGRGAVIYSEYRPDVPEIRLDCVGEGHWLTRAGLRVFFAYPFVELGCRRITVICARRNRKARRFVEHVGFVHEGTCRQAMPNGDNAVIYGMLRRECRWLKGSKHVLQTSRRAA